MQPLGMQGKEHGEYGMNILHCRHCNRLTMDGEHCVLYKSESKRKSDFTYSEDGVEKRAGRTLIPIRNVKLCKCKEDKS